MRINVSRSLLPGVEAQLRPHTILERRDRDLSARGKSGSAVTKPKPNLDFFLLPIFLAQLPFITYLHNHHQRTPYHHVMSQRSCQAQLDGLASPKLTSSTRHHLVRGSRMPWTATAPTVPHRGRPLLVSISLVKQRCANPTIVEPHRPALPATHVSKMCGGKPKAINRWIWDVASRGSSQAHVHTTLGHRAVPL